MRNRHGINESYDQFAAGLLAGAGLMYLLDPDRGGRRRARVRDQGIHLAHRAADGSGTTARDLRNRTRGLVAEASGRFRPDGAPDEVIEARIRSELGRLVSHPGAIEVRVLDGIATLRGDVLADEAEILRRGVERVRGVREVRSQVTSHRNRGDVPGLQGNPRKPQNRPELLQENWAPATRLLAGGLGGLLVLGGRRIEGPIGVAAGFAGTGLLLRALTNLETRRLTGVNAGRRAIDLHKIITIEAPVQEVFEFWSDGENFPRFMEHLKEVRNTGAGRSHWTAEGPAGIPVSWDAEITALRENELIAWKSIGTNPVGSAGIVRFQPVGENATRIDVRMSYNPPAGAIGHVIANLFGVDPRHAMDEDFVRLKSLLEDGKTTAHGEEISRTQQARRFPIEAGS